MLKWWSFALLLVVAILAVGCKQSAQTSSQSHPHASPVAGETSATEHASTCGSSAAEMETVNVTFRLPQEALEPMTTRATSSGLRGMGSPNVHLGQVLGVRMASAAGCVFAEVKPGGLAEKVGLKAGDIVVECNGGEPDCPSTLDSWLYCGKEIGFVEMTLKRPSGEGAACSGETCAVEAPSETK